MSKINEIKDLVEKLNRYSDAYYNKSQSLISDEKFDQLFDQLKELEHETGIVLSNSPTVNVGYDTKSELTKVTHSHPMLSLGKTKDTADLLKFMGKHECVLMQKMDGLTVLLTYEDGNLVKAETRGNGVEGENITHNAKVFENIPLHINLPGHVEFEGEAIITYNDYEKINEKIFDPGDRYRNPRNLASGSVRQLDSKIAKERHIKFILWKVPAGMDNINSFDLRMVKAKDLGFDTVPYVMLFPEEYDIPDHLDECIEFLKNKAKRLSYPIDGLVITYNDIKYGLSLGATEHHPRHSLAYKFYDDKYETMLLDIDWTMGKSGQLTPTAIFAPVEIDGTEVSRASLHNVSIMKSLQLYKGDTITVYKANAIIPQVDDNLTRNSVYGSKCEIPDKCPICGEPTQIIKENDSEILMCMNAQCKGKLLGELNAFVSKKAHDIKGLSETTLSLMIQTGLISSPIDLYHLEDKRKELSYLPKMGAKKVDNLLKAIEESRNTTLEKFIVGLNIPLIGSHAAKDIAKFEEMRAREKGYNLPFSSFLNDILHGFDFSCIDGLGAERSMSIKRYANENIEYIEKLSVEFYFPDRQKVEEKLGSTSLNGMKFCITGKLHIFSNRDELVADIESKGGKVVSEVTNATNYLITNDKTSGSSKNKKAAELNIPIISEEEYIKM